MSSDMESALAQLQSNDYMSLVIAIAVSYDYCLTFSKEVAYIWKRPWTRVSTLFLIIRYVGCLSALTFALDESSFIPGPVKVRHSCLVFANHLFEHCKYLDDIRRNIIHLVGVWARAIFWAGADMVMILRVYAMYNRSRIVLGVLLVMYITEVVTILVSSSIYSNPNYAAVSIAQLFNVTICNVVFSTQTPNIVPTIFQFILGTVLCILVMAQYARDSLQVYRATRQWQLNKYMNLLARDGLFYFLVTLLNSLLNMLGILGIIPQGWATLVLIPVANVPLYTLTPRFVVNVRKLYMLDMQGRWDCDIDTGFGLSSGAGRDVGGSTTTGTIAFAEGGGIGGFDDGEEMATAGETAVGGGRPALVV